MSKESKEFVLAMEGAFRGVDRARSAYERLFHTCLECHKPLRRPKDGVWPRFCGRSCVARWEKREDAELAASKIRKCLVCGVEFEIPVKGRKKVYCGPSCRKRSSRSK